MTAATPEIRLIPVDQITVLNPRSRNKRIFNELVASVSRLGLKKPITVSERKKGGYDLVCGQGRLEAFASLGQKEIPAVVMSVSKEDCFVMSLVENLARRQHSPLELIREIGALKTRGYSYTEIAAKLDFSVEYVNAICHLLDNGEERLLAAVERGVMPHTIAMEIVRAKDGDVQAALADAYQAKALPGNQVTAIRRIIEQRAITGKTLHSIGGRPATGAKKVTAVALVRSYLKESERQKLMIMKARMAESRLVFVAKALKKLSAEDHFMALLRADHLHDIPRPLAERMDRMAA